jgi:hypothetical protein
MAFFGPSVGIVIISRTPAGIFARTSSTAEMRPVRRYSITLSATDFPTFGILRRAAVSRSDTSA